MGLERASHVWRVTLLGEMCFYDASVGAEAAPLSIALPTQKTRLLLAYLLLHPKTAHSRERLAALLWPDSNAERARRSLRGAISAMNTAFKKAPDGSFAPALWLPDTHNLKLAPGLFITDVAEWEELRSAADADTSAGRLALLRQATRLYTGPLLPGMDDIADAEPWLEPLRVHYAEMHRAVLWEVSRLSEASGNLPRALEFARRARDADNGMGVFDEDGAESFLLERLQAQTAGVSLSAVSAAVPKPPKTPRMLSSAKLPLPISSAPPPEPQPLAPSPPLPPDNQRGIVSRTGAATVVVGGGVAVAVGGLLYYGGRRGQPATITAAPPATPTSAATPRPADPGYLGKDFGVKGSNAFTASAAQGMETKDYERSLGYFQKQLALATTSQERILLADKILALGQSAHYRDIGQGGISLAAYELALTVYRPLKSMRRIAWAQIGIANAALLRGDRVRAVRALRDAQQALFATPGDLTGYANLPQVGELLVGLGDYDEARRTFDAFLRRGEGQPWAQGGIAHSLRYLGVIASDQGKYADAETRLTQSAERFAILKDKQTRADVIAALADCRLRQGDLRRPMPLYRETLSVWQECGQKFWIAQTLARIARLQAYRSETTEAAHLVTQSLEQLEKSNGPTGRALPLLVLGRVHILNNFPEQAIGHLREALALRRRIGNPRGVAEVLEWMAVASDAGMSRDEARRHLREADALRRQVGTPIPPIDRPALDRLRRQIG